MTPHFPPFKSIYSQVYGKMRSEIVMVVFFYFLDWTSESRENLIIVRRWRGVMAMLITVALFTSDQRSQSLAMMEQISLSLLSIFIMMMVIDHCIYMKPMIPLQYPLSPPIIHKSGKWSTILEKRYTLRKKVSLTPKKVKLRAPKKVLFRNNQGMYILQKNRSNLVNLGLGSLISDLQTAIGGHHPVLYFTTQITEKYSTAMC